jgi:hypothetical protein
MSTYPAARLVSAQSAGGRTCIDSKQLDVLPYSYIGRTYQVFRTRKGDLEEGPGTGILIGDRFVLTAAHNILADVLQDEFLRPAPVDAMLFRLPDGREARASEWRVFEEEKYRQFRDSPTDADRVTARVYDVAILKLDRPLAHCGTVETWSCPWYGSIDDSVYLRHPEWFISAYDADLNKTDRCLAERTGRPERVASSGSLRALWRMQSEIKSGASGGPLWIWWNAPGHTEPVPAVVGIVSGGGKGVAVGREIDATLREWITSYVRQPEGERPEEAELDDTTPPPDEEPAPVPTPPRRESPLDAILKELCRVDPRGCE